MTDILEFILKYGGLIYILGLSFGAFKLDLEASKTSKVESIESTVVCLNCRTSLPDTGKQFCSYCGLNLHVIHKNLAKAISLSEKPKLDHKEQTVTCVNCNFEVVNPTTNLCSNCGLDMLIKSLYKNCSNCGSDYENKLQDCPICGAN